MDPAPFLEFERAQEIMDRNDNLSYEQALEVAKWEIGRENA
jgi:hypothetical protein